MLESKIDNIIGKKVKIFTKTSFAFRGEVKGIYNGFIEIFDDVSKSKRLVMITNISNLEVFDGE